METTQEISSFSELGLPTGLCTIVKQLGYEVPTPIQIQSIPVVLAGKDLIGQAQTGTGKTAAYALPLLSKITFERGDPQVLVLTPTRELAIQVAEAFKSYAGPDERFHVLPIYGGQSIGIQFRQLERRPQVIVGTPGRVMDHLRRKSLSLASIRALVIDEADEMLSMGFQEDIEWIISHAPAEKQTTLLSATMPRTVRRVAQTYLREPVEVNIQKVAADEALIEQSFWLVNGIHKLDALTRILEANEFDGVLIFVRTKTAAVELAEKLEARGYSAGALNGDMSQDIRERTVDRLKLGRLDILVATDVAARGLHVERISHVINFDIPFDSETYTHRIGRTGRAGRTGTAILFVSARERGLLRSIERGTGNRIEPFRMPSREDISQRRTEKLKAKIVAALQNSEVEEYSKVIAEVVDENGTSATAVAAALCCLLQQDGPAPIKELPASLDEQVTRNYTERQEPRAARSGERNKKKRFARPNHSGNGNRPGNPSAPSHKKKASGPKKKHRKGMS